MAAGMRSVVHQRAVAAVEHLQYPHSHREAAIFEER